MQWKTLFVAVGIGAIGMQALLAAAAAAPLQDDNVSVEVVGLALAKPDPDSEFGWSAIPGRNAGTEVHLRITAKGQTILELASGGDDAASRLKFASPDGKALKTERDGSDLGFLSQISEDGQHCTFPIQSEELPPPGANALTISGKVKLTTGSDLQKQRVRIDVQPNAEIQIGKLKLTLAEVEEDMFGEDAWTLTFQSEQPLSTIKEFKFFDDAGEEIESSSAGSHSFGFGQQMTYGRAFSVKGKPTAIHVEASYFASTREIVVPLDLTFELNLGKK